MDDARETLVCTLLDEMQVSKIAEYLGRRLELEDGQTMLQLEFVDGRYDRLRRFNKAATVPKRRPAGRPGA